MPSEKDGRLESLSSRPRILFAGEAANLHGSTRLPCARKALSSWRHAIHLLGFVRLTPRKHAPINNPLKIHVLVSMKARTHAMCH